MKFIILFCVLAALAASSVGALSSPLELLHTQENKLAAGSEDFALGSQYDAERHAANLRKLKNRLLAHLEPFVARPHPWTKDNGRKLK